MKSEIDIVYACLHSTVFFPNVGQHGPTLTKSDIGKHRISKMTLLSNTLKVEIAGSKNYLLIPLANITHMVATEE